MNPKLITLHISEGNWIATWTGPEEVKIRQLFGGQNSLVTAFNHHAPAGMVEREIARLNPGYEVEVAL